MEPRAFNLPSSVAPTGSLSVIDCRETDDADEELIEVALQARHEPSTALAVAFDLEDLRRLRQILDEVIARDLPSHR